MGYENDLANLGIMSGGMDGFIKGMNDGEDRKMRRIELEAKLKSKDEDRKRQGFMDALEARSKGFKVPEGGELYDQKASNLEYDPAYIQLQREKALANDPFGIKGQRAQNAELETTSKKLDIATKSQDLKRKSMSPLQGYDKSDSYVGTPEEEKHLRTAYTDMNKFNQTMNNLKARVAKADQAEIANPLSDASKNIRNDLRDLQLIYKGPAFAQLGVLAGPDMAILDDIVENPGKISNLISGKNGVLQRYDQAQSRVNQGFEAKAQTLGLVKSGLVGKKEGLVKAPKQKTLSPEDQAAIDWAKANPKDPRSAQILKANGQ